MSMSDKEFSEVLREIELAGGISAAMQLRARDTDQREALARVEAERDAERARGDAVGDANEAEAQLAELQSAYVTMTNQTMLVDGEYCYYLKSSEMAALDRIFNDAQAEQRDTIKAQLAEAVGLLKEAGAYFGWVPVPSLVGDIADFLARHAQVEQCCEPTSEEKAALQAGDCTPEELWGGPSPTCPKCIDRGALAEQQEAQGAQAVDERAAFEEAWIKLYRIDVEKCPEFHPKTFRTGTSYQREVGGDYIGSAWWAWQARAALATQPAAGEPVAWMVKKTFNGREKTLELTEHKHIADFMVSEYSNGTERLLPLYIAPPAAAPVASGEPLTGKRLYGMYTGPSEYQHDKWRVVTDQHADWNRLADRLSAMMAAPPADPHGDEAVRKDAKRYRWLREHGRQPVEVRAGGRLVYRDRMEAAIDAVMRAQAGEGGE